MASVKGQCFDCYGDSMFQYFGQTSDYNPSKVQLEYIAKLIKPLTVVDCVSCARIIEYRERNGVWEPTVRS